MTEQDELEWIVGVLGLAVQALLAALGLLAVIAGAIVLGTRS